jgi:hypothetical protein
MVESYQLERWIERVVWRNLAIQTFEQCGDCRLVYYALFRWIELYGDKYENAT